MPNTGWLSHPPENRVLIPGLDPENQAMKQGTVFLID